MSPTNAYAYLRNLSNNQYTASNFTAPPPGSLTDKAETWSAPPITWWHKAPPPLLAPKTAILCDEQPSDVMRNHLRLRT
jgi:hypothetical protein